MIYLDFEEVIKVENVGQLLFSPQFRLFEATFGTIELTEIRFYGKKIPNKILKSQSRQPLSILFELSRNLAIKISKKIAVINNEPSIQKADDNKPKKKGVLKLKSKFDKNKPKQ